MHESVVHLQPSTGTSSDRSYARFTALLPAAGGPVAVAAILSRRCRNRAAGTSLASASSWWSVLGFASLLSVGSACSVLSIGSYASILGVGSSGSILSVGSSNSILGIGSGASRSRRRGCSPAVA
jgi:hypothetical protein